MVGQAGSDEPSLLPRYLIILYNQMSWTRASGMNGRVFRAVSVSLPCRTSWR